MINLKFWNMLGNVARYCPVPNNRGVLIKGVGVGFRRITYVSINGDGDGGPNKTRGVWKLFSGRSGNPLPLIIGTVLAKPWSAKGSTLKRISVKYSGDAYVFQCGMQSLIWGKWSIITLNWIPVANMGWKMTKLKLVSRWMLKWAWYSNYYS